MADPVPNEVQERLRLHELLLKQLRAEGQRFHEAADALTQSLGEHERDNPSSTERASAKPRRRKTNKGRQQESAGGQWHES